MQKAMSDSGNRGNKYLIAGASSGIGLALLDIVLRSDPDAILYLLARDTKKISCRPNYLSNSFRVHLLHFDLLSNNIPLQKEWNINYAIIFPGSIPENNEQYMESIHVNFTGIIQLTEQLVNLYSTSLKNILITTSTAGVRVRKNNYIYGSAKAGLIGYCSGLRHRLSPYIHVTTLIPGPIKTGMIKNIQVSPWLVETPDNYAKKIYKAIFRRRNFVYSSFRWKILSWFLLNVPESLLLNIAYEMKTK